MCGDAHSHDGGHAREHDHRHGDGHDHDHPHDHFDPERYYGGAVMLDIGGDHGALLVELDDTWLDRELFIRPAGRHDGEFHVAVWQRPTGDGVSVSAIFGSLLEGDYEVLEGPGGSVLRTVNVVGAELASIALDPSNI